ncbi:MAG: alanyl-tRNA synthetase [Parcubacteria group bacterium Gr01-1014_66]|nr:MAG: alanyl-tRNA synthetase [Parcubacteria group bacterium Gr01-1014_66]
MRSSEIRQKFLDFFTERGHTIVPSSSLIPDDPSVLLTTAGMQQFKKYYTAPEMADRDFGSRNTVSVQKSFRVSDIDEVGDEQHLTFFEMLGNFSFGGYFKEEAIKYAYRFLTDSEEQGGLGLTISYVTVFEGVHGVVSVPEDTDSQKIWQSIDPCLKIVKQGMDDVFWGPTGSGGPCGPTTEIYCKNDAMDEPVEIWNIVFNEFLCSSSREQLMKGGATLTPLEVKGIDTGMGLERLTMVAQGKKNVFETDLFRPLMDALPALTGGWSARIASDHARAIAFLIGDGVRPSNKEIGYILRRLIRRVIPHLRFRLAIMQEGSPPPMHQTIKDLVEKAIDYYGRLDVYSYLFDGKQEILKVVEEEQERFSKVYDKGNNILGKLIDEAKDNTTYLIEGVAIFRLVTTYGFALEWIKDKAKLTGVTLDLLGFEKEFKKHKEISRAGATAKFGGHGLYLKTGEVTIRDESEVERVTRLHTATHLLHAALRAILGKEVQQDGSDITAERTRFDFRFSRKLTQEEIQKVEEWVNNAIDLDLIVSWEEMSYADALKQDALGFFREKYPPCVKVYSMISRTSGGIFSRELCGGPHVTHTREIGRFRILKQEASGAGVRRIRAIIEERKE